MPVYKQAKKLRSKVRLLLKKFPEHEKFALINQGKRAIDSVCLNIAEGSNRDSDKDKAHFLNQSATSLEEIVALFDIALDDGYISQVEMNDIIIESEDLGKQLIALGRYLKRKK